MYEIVIVKVSGALVCGAGCTLEVCDEEAKRHGWVAQSILCFSAQGIPLTTHLTDTLCPWIWAPNPPATLAAM